MYFNQFGPSIEKPDPGALHLGQYPIFKLLTALASVVVFDQPHPHLIFQVGITHNSSRLYLLNGVKFFFFFGFKNTPFQRMASSASSLSSRATVNRKPFKGTKFRAAFDSR